MSVVKEYSCAKKGIKTYLSDYTFSNFLNHCMAVYVHAEDVDEINRT